MRVSPVVPRNDFMFLCDVAGMTKHYCLRSDICMETMRYGICQAALRKYERVSDWTPGNNISY